MKKIEVNLGERSYPIVIDRTPLIELLDQYFKDSRIFIVTNDTLSKMYSSWLKTISRADCIIIPNGEAFKNLTVYENIQTELIKRGADRSSIIVAFGGGVVGDISGFVAATYMRGIPLIQVPTSLLAMVDSSVGGKVGVNHALGKNLIGAFYQPSFVYINLDFLRTLPEREFNCGLAEIIKYGCIYDSTFFEFFESVKNFNEEQTLEKMISSSCSIKAQVVGADERESGLRMILNFGHTWGHAFENLSGYGLIKHGEAVFLGMLAAGYFSMLNQMLSASDFDRMENLIHRLIEKILNNPEISDFFKKLRFEDVYSKMKGDKKSQNGEIKWVLLSKLGEAMVVKSDDKMKMAKSLDFVKSLFVKGAR